MIYASLILYKGARFKRNNTKAEGDEAVINQHIGQVMEVKFWQTFMERWYLVVYYPPPPVNESGYSPGYMVSSHLLTTQYWDID